MNSVAEAWVGSVFCGVFGRWLGVVNPYAKFANPPSEGQGSSTMATRTRRHQRRRGLIESIVKYHRFVQAGQKNAATGAVPSSVSNSSKTKGCTRSCWSWRTQAE